MLILLFAVIHLNSFLLTKPSPSRSKILKQILLKDAHFLSQRQINSLECQIRFFAPVNLTLWISNLKIFQQVALFYVQNKCILVDLQNIILEPDLEQRFNLSIFICYILESINIFICNWDPIFFTQGFVFFNGNSSIF